MGERTSVCRLTVFATNNDALSESLVAIANPFQRRLADRAAGLFPDRADTAEGICAGRTLSV
mgnify:CR=1 FL=1